ncbi:hypothetical protein Rs2_38915 [Raphanus sativus]|nr:hypothetical protein Rs2_38915 [Raphanus sativus]
MLVLKGSVRRFLSSDSGSERLSQLSSPAMTPGVETPRSTPPALDKSSRRLILKTVVDGFWIWFRLESMLVYRRRCRRCTVEALRWMVVLTWLKLLLSLCLWYRAWDEISNSRWKLSFARNEEDESVRLESSVIVHRFPRRRFRRSPVLSPGKIGKIGGTRVLSFG